MMWLIGLSMAVGGLATVEDLRSRTISNWLCLAGVVAGLTAHAAMAGWSGLGDALLGTFIGFAVFLVFFLLGGMGGGDIKLMAAFGAILGKGQIVEAAIFAAMVDRAPAPSVRSARGCGRPDAAPGTVRAPRRSSPHQATR